MPASNWPAFAALDRHLPRDRTVVFDHGALANRAITFIRADHPSATIFMGDFGSLGLSLTAAAGAAMRGRSGIRWSSSATAQRSCRFGELDNLKRSGASVTVAVFNDGAYGAELPYLTELGAPVAMAIFDSEPIAGIARVMGLDVIASSEADDLEQAFRGHSSAWRPSLIEIRCRKL